MNKLTDILKDVYNTSTIDQLNDYFTIACREGHLDIVEYLLTSPSLEKNVNIHFNDDEGFRKACGYNHLEVVQFLVSSPHLNEHANTHAINDLGFMSALKKNYLDIVQFLIFDTDLKETVVIKKYIENKPDIKKMFQIKKLHTKINNDIEKNEDGQTNKLDNKRNKI